MVQSKLLRCLTVALADSPADTGQRRLPPSEH